MVKIFAKHGTSEKVLCVCTREEAGAMQAMLNNQLGGNWVWVDKVHPGEVLKFDDGLTYLGYDEKSSRYVSGVFKPVVGIGQVQRFG